MEMSLVSNNEKSFHSSKNLITRTSNITEMYHHITKSTLRTSIAGEKPMSSVCIYQRRDYNVISVPSRLPNSPSKKHTSPKSLRNSTANSDLCAFRLSLYQSDYPLLREARATAGLQRTPNRLLSPLERVAHFKSIARVLCAKLIRMHGPWWARPRRTNVSATLKSSHARRGWGP